MSLRKEPAPAKPEHPTSSPRPKATFIKGLGLGLLVAIVLTFLLMPQKGLPALLIPAVAFLGTVVVWTFINSPRNRPDGVDFDSPQQRASRRRSRVLLAFAALLVGPFGGAWVGLMIVLFSDVNPLDRATTIGAPAFLGLIASVIVATTILVSSFQE
jgi:hypothetical protein